MLTVVAFVVAIALLVVFHEWGHYWVARRCGVKVLRFSVGFGKVVLRKQFHPGATEWVVSAIPLGGYVKMLDEREREGEVPEEAREQAFNRRPVWQRMAIVAAGPLANFMLAILLYWLVFMAGVPGLKPVLGAVPPESPAAHAALQPGMQLTAVAGVPVQTWQDVRWQLMEQVLQQQSVRIDFIATDGVSGFSALDVGQLQPDDLDGEFLDTLGLKLALPEVQPVIGQVVAGGAAEAAGLRAGDRIVRVDGRPLQRWDELVQAVRSHPGQLLAFEVERDAASLALEVVPSSVEEQGAEVGRIGAAPEVDRAAWQALQIEVRHGPLDALREAGRKTWDTAWLSLRMLGRMVLGEVSMKNLSGPITIADYAGQSASIGWVAYLGFLALISISLGVLNLLPIPLLDGGHLLYYSAEWVTGRPVPERVWEFGQRIGIALLGTLMLFALYNDIHRLVSG